MNKDKIIKESQNIKTTHNKGVSLSDWLGNDKSNNFDY